MDHSLEQPMSQLTSRELNRVVSNPGVFCGGGSVAALTGSSAAALTELVLRLASRRRANRDYQEAIEYDLKRTNNIQKTLHDLADQDVQVLDTLLAAQRSAKEKGERTAYFSALVDAAKSPLTIGSECTELLGIIDANMGRATRFTVSDLGAAAALAQGAVRAVIFTAEVNVALLREEDVSNPGQIDELEREAERQLETSDALARSIFERTLAAISHRTSEKQL